MRAACGVGQEQQSTDEISFDLENDLTPDPGELIISELMLTSDHPGGNYIEIHSLANHTLDLDGVALQRWNAGLAPTDAPSSRFDIGVPSGTLLIEPGDDFLMARSEDPADNGCLNPDLVLDASFTLYVNSSLGWGACSWPMCRSSTPTAGSSRPTRPWASILRPTATRAGQTSLAGAVS